MAKNRLSVFVWSTYKKLYGELYTQSEPCAGVIVSSNNNLVQIHTNKESLARQIADVLQIGKDSVRYNVAHYGTEPFATWVVDTTAIGPVEASMIALELQQTEFDT